MTVPVYSGTVPNPVQSQPDFDTNTQEFIDYVASLAPALNEFAETINSADTTSTSSTSVAIGTGSKSFTVETGKSYVLGMSLKIANTATNYMVGDVISYNSGTGALVVNVVATSGTGTYSSWTISIGFSGLVDTVQIANNAVTTDKINNLAVTTGKIADSNVTTAKIADANVTLAKLQHVGTAGQILTSNGTGSAPSYQARVFSATAQASTSGTEIDFTGIPSWVKRVTVMFSQVSTNGSSNYLIQIGDSGGIEITGYSCVSQRAAGTAVAMVGYTQGLGISTSGAGESLSGGVTLLALGTSNTWVMSGNLSEGNGRMYTIAGTKSLSDTLTQVRITTVNGTDTFDAGSINILYE